MSAAPSNRCEGCGEHSFLIPLHGGKGGPLRCPLCVGMWNAEHGRRRRAGRIVIRAIRAFLDAGGKYVDIDKLKLSASGGDLGWDIDPLGYMDGIARLDGADADLTSELLADAIKIAHPDHQPPERKALAHRVTQGLLALQPFVFPAATPKPKKPDAPRTNPDNDSIKKDSTNKKLFGDYPCPDCSDTTPYFYCDVCSAEYDRREQEKFKQRTANQRARYKRCKHWKMRWRSLRQCEECGLEFKKPRTDARYCSDTCQQRAHRRAKALVTDKHNARLKPITCRDKAAVLEGRILAVLERHPAVFLNGLLPENRTRAQYQALCSAAINLETAGKIDSFCFWTRCGKPGFKALARPGHKIDHVDQVPRLKASERSRFAEFNNAAALDPVAEQLP